MEKYMFDIVAVSMIVIVAGAYVLRRLVLRRSSCCGCSGGSCGSIASSPFTKERGCGCSGKK